MYQTFGLRNYAFSIHWNTRQTLIKCNFPPIHYHNFHEVEPPHSFLGSPLSPAGSYLLVFFHFSDDAKSMREFSEPLRRRNHACACSLPLHSLPPPRPSALPGPSVSQSVSQPHMCTKRERDAVNETEQKSSQLRTVVEFWCTMIWRH